MPKIPQKMEQPRSGLLVDDGVNNPSLPKSSEYLVRIGVWAPFLGLVSVGVCGSKHLLTRYDWRTRVILWSYILVRTIFSSGRHFRRKKSKGAWKKDSKIFFAPVFYQHVPSISFTVTLQGTNISHLGKRKIIFNSALSGGYVNFLEGTVFGPNHIVMKIWVCVILMFVQGIFHYPSQTNGIPTKPRQDFGSPWRDPNSLFEIGN